MANGAQVARQIKKETIAEPKDEIDFITKIVPLNLIDPNPDQPRKYFNEATLETMAKTITKTNDIRDPLKLSPLPNGRYIIIDGERRYKSAIKKGLSKVPAMVKKYAMHKDDIFVESALRNFCRESMSVVEEAYAYKRIMDRMKWSVEKVAETIGKSPAQIYNAFKVFKLHKEIQSLLLCGKVNSGLGLRLSSYDISDQQMILNACQSEITRIGKPMQSNDLNRFIKKYAEDNNIKPIRSKRGKLPLDHKTLVIRSLMRSAEKFKKELDELINIPFNDLKVIKEPTLFEIIGQIKETIIKAKKVNKELNENYD